MNILFQLNQKAKSWQILYENKPSISGVLFRTIIYLTARPSLSNHQRTHSISIIIPLVLYQFRTNHFCFLSPKQCKVTFFLFCPWFFLVYSWSIQNNIRAIPRNNFECISSCKIKIKSPNTINCMRRVMSPTNWQ